MQHMSNCTLEEESHEFVVRRSDDDGWCNQRNDVAD